jgi:hypothetical protein
MANISQINGQDIYATSAGFATTAGLATLATSSISASYAATASILLGSVTSASFATTSSFATSASFSPISTTAAVANSVEVFDTTTGTGPFFVMFADGTTNNRVPRVDSSTFTYNATTNIITVTSSFASTSSFATTSSFVGPTLNQNLTISGTLSVTNLVAATSSIQYITSSQLDISTNIIKLNTTAPLRYGGIAVVDSGSSPQLSGSLLFDSQNNQWIYIHQSAPAAAITSSVVIMGPQTFNNVGNEIAITTNRLTKGSPGDIGEHITSSNITDTGTVVSINSQTQITGSLRGQVSTLSITSNTASVDMSTNNFFTLTLVNGANTHINPTNINPGQTVNIRVTQGSLGTGTVSFPSFVDQPTGSLYTGSQVANAIDIVTMITFDSSLVFMSSIRNMV